MASNAKKVQQLKNQRLQRLSQESQNSQDSIDTQNSQNGKLKAKEEAIALEEAKNYSKEEAIALERCTERFHAVISKNSNHDKDKEEKQRAWESIKISFDEYCKSQGIYVS